MDGEGNNALLSPILHHINLGLTSELDQLDLDAVDRNSFTKVHLYIDVYK